MVRSVPTARGAVAAVRKDSGPRVRDAKARVTAKSVTPVRVHALAVADAKRGGPRGSAPWAARHAAKHAAEAAARNASPPPPGSARATLRTPDDADELKARLTDLSQAIARVKQLKRTFGKDFWEISNIMGQISELRLFEAKGYATFEAFADRELELGKSTALRLIRIPKVFQESAAREIGLNALMAALEGLDGDKESQSRIAIAAPVKPLKPPSMVRS
jgi:hypothetical protein